MPCGTWLRSPAMSDGVDVRPLLEALQKRGAGQPSDPNLGLVETLRTCTEWTGEVFPQQLTNLKRSAMLIMNSTEVTLGVDTENHLVHYVFTAGPGRPDAKTVDARLQGLVSRVLGRGWSAVRDTLTAYDTRPDAGKSRRVPKPKRTRGRKKTRNR